MNYVLYFFLYFQFIKTESIKFTLFEETMIIFLHTGFEWQFYDTNTWIRCPNNGVKFNKGRLKGQTMHLLNCHDINTVYSTCPSMKGCGKWLTFLVTTLLFLGPTCSHSSSSTACSSFFSSSAASPLVVTGGLANATKHTRHNTANVTHGLSQYLETGFPNRGFIDLCVSKVWNKVHSADEIDPIYLQILLF